MSCRVALLAEGVDRNSLAAMSAMSYLLSPSSRRAWIEIGPLVVHKADLAVALLAEGVDRNNYSGGSNAEADCRPPRGGRG